MVLQSRSRLVFLLSGSLDEDSWNGLDALEIPRSSRLFPIPVP